MSKKARGSAPKHYAYCLQCCGGGKQLNQPGPARDANRAATSHIETYGHPVTILQAQTPTKEETP